MPGLERGRGPMTSFSEVVTELCLHHGSTSVSSPPCLSGEGFVVFPLTPIHLC